MTLKTTAAVVATTLMLAAPAFAQQGTTLAGPAQGQKSDGSASTTPSAESGANGGAMTKSGGAMTGPTASGDGKSTATGGNPGGRADRQ